MKAATEAKAVYNFQVESEDGVHTISYRQAPYGPVVIFWMMILFGALLAIPAMFMENGGAIWLVGALVVPVLVYIIVNAARRSQSFHISPEAFMAKGVKYARRHVSDIFITAYGSGDHTQTVRQGKTNAYFAPGDFRAFEYNESKTTVISFLYGLRDHYASKNYGIGCMFGEQRIILATGLSRRTCNLMFRAVCELCAN